MSCAQSPRCSVGHGVLWSRVPFMGPCVHFSLTSQLYCSQQGELHIPSLLIVLAQFNNTVLLHPLLYLWEKCVIFICGEAYGIQLQSICSFISCQWKPYQCNSFSEEYPARAREGENYRCVFCLILNICIFSPLSEDCTWAKNDFVTNGKQQMWLKV